MRILSGRVLIKKHEDKEDVGAMTWSQDDDELPKATVVLVADDVKSIVAAGDEIYYMESRERGKCRYQDSEHFIIPIANVIAVL